MQVETQLCINLQDGISGRWQLIRPVSGSVTWPGTRISPPSWPLFVRTAPFRWQMLHLRYTHNKGAQQHALIQLCPALDEVPGDEPSVLDTCRSLRQSFKICIPLDGAHLIKCCCDVQMGPAKQISLGGDVFPLLQSHIVDGAQSVAGLRKHARLACKWGQHPMTLLLAAGLCTVLCCIEKPSRSQDSSQQAAADRSLPN